MILHEMEVIYNIYMTCVLTQSSLPLVLLFLSIPVIGALSVIDFANLIPIIDEASRWLQHQEQNIQQMKTSSRNKDASFIQITTKRPHAPPSMSFNDDMHFRSRLFTTYSRLSSILSLAVTSSTDVKGSHSHYYNPIIHLW